MKEITAEQAALHGKGLTELQEGYIKMMTIDGITTEARWAVFEEECWTGDFNRFHKLVITDVASGEIINGNRWERSFSVRGLEDVGVGDTVVLRTYVRRSRHLTLETAEKVTKTQITVNGKRYMRSTGDQYGSRSTYSPDIKVYDEVAWITHLHNEAWYEHKTEHDRYEKELRDQVLTAVRNASIEDVTVIAELLSVI
jgi:hypothetical protein